MGGAAAFDEFTRLGSSFDFGVRRKSESAAGNPDHTDADSQTCWYGDSEPHSYPTTDEFRNPIPFGGSAATAKTQTNANSDTT